MDATKARRQFNAALKQIAKIRFLEYPDWPSGDKVIRVKPCTAQLCDPKKCNAGCEKFPGRNCIHRIIKKNIPFCVD